MVRGNDLFANWIRQVLIQRDEIKKNLRGTDTESGKDPRARDLPSAIPFFRHCTRLLDALFV